MVGDGRIAFFIKDLVVLPQYQGMESVRRCCAHHHAFENTAATMRTLPGWQHPARESFYDEHGFLRRPAPGYGSGLVKFVDPFRSAQLNPATSGTK